MKKTVACIALVVLALASTSCDIGSVTLGSVKTGPTVTEEIKMPVPDGATASEVEISMGGGDLSITVEDIDGLVEGTISYNVEDIEPVVQTSGGRVQIEQGDLEGKRIPLGNWSDVVNRWDLVLGETPLKLTVNAGAAKAVLTGLADLRASDIAFRGGAGEFRLDFSGDLMQDMRVAIDAGAAQVTIVVPEGMPAELEFEGALTDIDTGGAWQRSGGKYVVAGEGPRITFTVRMGVGELDLRGR